MLYNKDMKFSLLAQQWQKLESTASRNEMMKDLAEVLKKSGAEEVDKLCYLSLGRLGPLFANVEFNLAEKMMVRAVAQAVNKEEREIKKLYKQTGDLGLVVEFARLDSKAKRPTSYDASLESSLAVVEVYSELLKIARQEGEGSQERKLRGMAELLGELDPLSARYVVRIPLKKMRLGFSDKTILDALSFMRRGDKSGKKQLEEAYKVRPDIGRLARIVKGKGIKGVAELLEPEIGVPILMAKAQRMSSAEEILSKIGKCAVEPKIDGFRLQVHLQTNSKSQAPSSKQIQNSNDQNSKQGNRISSIQYPVSSIKLFTRNLDDVTYMYPDIVAAVKQQIKAESVIFEGEAVAYNPQTGEFLPFQETVQRKRKYQIEKYVTDVPLKLIVFDCLYLNGQSLLQEPYVVRRKKLETILR